MKEKAKKWSKFALYMLVIPVLGMMFINGWNWKWNDFLFMFCFIFIFGMIYEFVASYINNKKYKFLAGIVFIIGAMLVWGMFATG